MESPHADVDGSLRPSTLWHLPSMTAINVRSVVVVALTVAASGLSYASKTRQHDVGTCLGPLISSIVPITNQICNLFGKAPWICQACVVSVLSYMLPHFKKIDWF